MGDPDPHTWFLGPTRVLNSNDILIGSAVFALQGRGVYPPIETYAQSPKPEEILRGGQGVVLPVCPIRSPHEIFVQYNWTSAVKIMLFMAAL